MSSMPERDAPGHVGRGQQSARPGEWGTPSQGTMPGHQQFGGVPSGGDPGQPAGDVPGGHWGSQPGSGSPVSEAETRVTWRRIFQFWIDAFLVSIVPYLVSIPFDRSSSTLMNILGGLVYVVLFVLIGIWYWVIWPHHHSGQTFAMKWLGPARHQQGRWSGKRDPAVRPLDLRCCSTPRRGCGRLRGWSDSLSCSARATASGSATTSPGPW